ncbi:ABC transporter ATP-binding protein [Alicyclobacillus dauci]|uniref:ABC transporter ATP-binding protein n=1 Tax=Alicyclobacillus dauci TaxID=1475485 RepID=A0ABY6YZZ7_9BACL|nr:ABC transporter ATP-binding protein [Alicyclobacillus dauci]WAH36195.1 ABC transporter ATP-binding protein [Alicyclobacillus dauci]
MTPKSELLMVDKLSVSFGGLQALKDVHLNIQEGQIVGLIGPNGAGKSTCLNTISGFVKATSGKADLLGQNLIGLKPFQTARLGISRTFQHTSLFADVSVRENFRRSLYSQHGQRIRDVDGHIKELCEKVHMTGMQDMIAGNLPYGAQRRLAIGLALACNPKLILLDEPAAGMNPSESKELVRIMMNLREEGFAILLVEHDMKVIMNVCDKITVLHHGEVLAQGTPTEIQENPAVLEAYLGTRRETHA